MSELANWYPFGQEDPIQGDPEAVRTAGEEYQVVAAAIATSAEELGVIADGLVQRSEAVEEVVSKARRLADRISLAQDRYRATGEALVTYAEGLAEAQRISAEARAAAARALDLQGTALVEVESWSLREYDATDPQVIAHCHLRANLARGALAAADLALEDAAATMYDAIHVRDAASLAAQQTIQAALDADGLHDTFGQNIGGGAQEVGLWAWEGADEAATKTGTAALVAGWVPAVGPAIATVSTAASGALLVRNGVNVMTGNGTWGEVGEAAVGVVSAGVGRLALQGLRMSAAGKGGRGVVAGGGSGTAGGIEKGALGALTAGRVEASVPLVRRREFWGVLSPRSIAADAARDVQNGVFVLRDGGELASAVREGGRALGAAQRADPAAFYFAAGGNAAVAAEAPTVLQMVRQGQDVGEAGTLLGVAGTAQMVGQTDRVSAFHSTMEGARGDTDD